MGFWSFMRNMLILGGLGFWRVLGWGMVGGGVWRCEMLKCGNLICGFFDGVQA